MKMAGKAQGMRVWRKLITMIALAFALVILADGFKIVSRADTGTTTTGVNMRGTPSKNGQLVTKLEQGTKVELGNLVDGKDGDGKKWYEVTYNGQSGYIRSDLIKKGAEGTGNETQTGTSTGEVEAVTPVGATIAGSNTVRVRTSASTTSSNNILTTVAKGTEVTVIGKVIGSDKKTWYQIRLTVEGNDVIGYVRSDYLAITGDIKPLEADPVQPDPVEPDPGASETTTKEPETVTPVKRYETALENDKWKLIDYENAVQYDIDDLFSAANKYKELYETADKKAKAKGGWLIFFIILAIAACAGVGYLLYRMKDIKEEAYISNIENNTPRRTAERPRGEARGGQSQGGRPAIRDGLEPRRDEGRPANGQRSSANRNQNPQGGRPAQPGQPQNGRPAQPGQPQNARPAQPGQPQNGRPAQQGQPQSARPAQPGQPQNARPAQPGQPQSARPAQQGQPQNGRPAQQGHPQNARPTQPGQPQMARPAQPGQPQMARPAQPAQPQDGRPAQQTAARPKNFAQDGDDAEFEFLNWDSDE